MARKKASKKPDRSNPQTNKSLAIRTVLSKLPNAKASEVAAAVKKEYGHDVRQNMVYMVKAKANMAADGRERKLSRSRSGGTPMTSPALWVSAIKTARELLQATGSVANATALLKALGDEQVRGQR